MAYVGPSMEVHGPCDLDNSSLALSLAASPGRAFPATVFCYLAGSQLDFGGKSWRARILDSIVLFGGNAPAVISRQIIVAQHHLSIIFNLHDLHHPLSNPSLDEITSSRSTFQQQ